MSETSTGRKTMIAPVLAGMFVLGVLSYGVWTNWPTGETTIAASEPMEVLEKVPPSLQIADAAAQAAPEEAVFDEIRRAADGVIVIAGQSAPGADIKILQDGAEIATATADSSGKFAAVALSETDGKAHVLTLTQTVEGQVLASKEEIILAPLTQPVVIAEPEPTPDPTPDRAQSPSLQPSDPTAPAQPQSGETASPAPVIAPEVPPKVAVLRTNEAGVELVQPVAPPPQAMANIVLDTISYSDAGDVQLAGRAQSQAVQVRVYLNNTAIADLPVDPSGNWRGDLPDVDEGIYTLRVDEVTADGFVSSRVETPFKRESAQTLAAAAPLDGPLKAITVQKGATLWAIARDRYGDGNLYLRVFEANPDAIRDPDLIYPGQVFDLPK